MTKLPENGYASQGEAPAARPAFGAEAFPLWAGAGLVTVLMWGYVAFHEANLGIFVVHALLMAGSLLLVWKLVPQKKGVLNILMVALALRTCAALIGYYSSPDAAFRYATGTNEDSIRFFEASLLPLGDGLLSFGEPGFPFLNYFVTSLCRMLGGPHYLASIQVVIFCGSLFPVVVHQLIKGALGSAATARTAAWILVLHPLAISFSTGLMRDSLVGCLGWTLVLLLARFPHYSKAWKAAQFLVIPLVCLLLASLRVVSSVTFLLLGAGTYLVFSRDRTRQLRWNRTTIGLVTAIVLVLASLLIVGGERLSTMLDFANRARAGISMGGAGAGAAGPNFEELNPNGLTQRLFQISPVLLLPLAPLQVMQPFPFFQWEPPFWIGGPPRFIDILVGFGGLFSQFLFGLFLVGVNQWRLEREWGKFFLCGVFILIAGWLNLIALGQVRYMMAHAYPFYFYGAALGYQSLQARGGGALRKFMVRNVIFIGSFYALLALYRILHG